MKPILAALVFILFICPIQVFAQVNSAVEHYYRATVVQDLGDAPSNDFEDFGELGEQGQKQKLEVKLLDGPDTGETVSVEYYYPYATDAVKTRDNALRTGETVVVLASETEEGTRYDVIEPYRISRLIILFLIFFALTIAIGRWRGLTSIAGLAASLFIIIWWMLPKLVAGANPIITAFFGSMAIAIVSLYLAHGFNRRTSVSVVSTLITLVASLGIASFAVSFSRMLGLGSEEAYYLTATNGAGLDLKGLLLGAIVIGAIGVLDDITTAQTATVEELHKANHRFTAQELFQKGMSVGKEHIASLVNTLVIAYVGASLPLFLLLTSTDRPLWVILNSEFISEEIVRTLAGSLTLVIAVPISTYLAALVFARKQSSSVI